MGRSAMPDVDVRWNPPDALKILAQNLRSTPSWMPKKIQATTTKIGPLGVRWLQYATMQNTYTGALGRSISAEYTDNGATVTISPKVMRGQYDGGLILELGTRPIPNAPFAPIARWANFKGLPPGAVWQGIRRKGVRPHPFLSNAFNSLLPDVNPLLLALLDDIIESGIFAGWPA